jgi:integrase
LISDAVEYVTIVKIDCDQRKTMTRITQQDDNALAQVQDLTFNFLLALPGRAGSRHTQRAYFRWIDTYLVDNAGMQPTKSDARVHRMQALPVRTLVPLLNASMLRAWLGRLMQNGHGKQGLDQARAAVVTLSDLMAEAELLDDRTAASLARVRPPRAEDGQRPGRWLSLDQIKALIYAGSNIATSTHQQARNAVVLNMLCTMALRREELSVARWGDLSIQNNRVVLRVHGKGRRMAIIDVPKPVIRALDTWRRLVEPDDPHPPPETSIVRRIWKGGRIADDGLSPDGIWLIIKEAAAHAGIGHVAPHDLRRSVAGALQESGVAIDTISRLLRHSNIAVTEKYLSRLPHVNEGAVLMSDALGMSDDWPGFE